MAKFDTTLLPENEKDRRVVLDLLDKINKVSGDVEVLQKTVDQGFPDPVVTTNLDESLVVVQEDFMSVASTSVTGPFFGAAIGAGTIPTADAGAVTQNHPGVVAISSSTTANSGYSFISSNVAWVSGATNKFTAILYFNNIAAATTIRFGFLDATNVTTPTDGVFFELSAGTLKGITKQAGTATTSSTFTPTTLNWYKFVILTNGSTASFAIYDSSTQNLIWSAASNTNLPTGTNLAGVGFIATNSGTTATRLCNLDYLAYTMSGITR